MHKIYFKSVTFLKGTMEIVFVTECRHTDNIPNSFVTGVMSDFIEKIFSLRFDKAKDQEPLYKYAGMKSFIEIDEHPGIARITYNYNIFKLRSCDDVILKRVTLHNSNSKEKYIFNKFRIK